MGKYGNSVEAQNSEDTCCSFFHFEICHHTQKKKKQEAEVGAAPAAMS